MGVGNLALRSRQTAVVEVERQLDAEHPKCNAITFDEQ